MLPPPPRSTLFPYTTLFRSLIQRIGMDHHLNVVIVGNRKAIVDRRRRRAPILVQLERAGAGVDRKSTRLNSSHVSISYAVFCLQKKKKQISGMTENHNYNQY